MTLNYNEQQVLLWIRSYEGITLNDLREKNIDNALRLKETIQALHRKGYIDSPKETEEWYAVQYMDIPDMEIIREPINAKP